MKEKQIKIPGPDHPISIQRNPARVVVSVAGRVIADTRNALTLREADYPPVQYIPREDVDLSQLERTDHATYCPYKGDCNYYSIPAGGKKSVNAVWTYEDPFPAVAQIKGHVAFYPDRVDEIAEQLPATRESSRSGVSCLATSLGTNDEYCSLRSAAFHSRSHGQIGVAEQDRHGPAHSHACGQLRACAHRTSRRILRAARLGGSHHRRMHRDQPRMLTVGLILLVYGALSRFVAGAGLLMPFTRRAA